MSNPERPIDLEMVAIGVPVTIRMRDAIESYAKAHTNGDGDVPSNADLLRRAIASIVKYDLATEAIERNKYSQRKQYDTAEDRIAARKKTVADAKALKDAAIAAFYKLSKDQQAQALRNSLAGK